MKFRVLLPILFFAWFGEAQIIDIDTLKPGKQTWSATDSLSSFIESSRSPLPQKNLAQGLFQNPYLLFQPMGSYLQPLEFKNNPLLVTALPYLGFAYSFGTQASQHMRMNYAQSFRKGLIINAQYVSHGANGFIRNNAWKNKDFSVVISKQSTRYQGTLLMDVISDSRQFSGGLQADSLALSFPLNLIPVLKDSCRADVKMRRVLLNQSFNLLRDTTKYFGIYLASSLQDFNRYYYEKDTLSGIYPMIAYDSSSTFDHFEKVDFKNEMGLGFSRKSLRFKAGLCNDLWRLRMRGNQRDTLELGIKGSLDYQYKKMDLKATFNRTLIGGFNEQFIAFGMNYKLSNGHQMHLSGMYHKEAPEVLQRFYFGNTAAYSMLAPQLQEVLSALVSIDGKILSMDYQLKMGYLHTANVYQFNGQFWLNNLNCSNVSMGDLGFKLRKSFKGFYLEPGINAYLFQPDYLPSLSIDGTAGFNGYITRTKSLYFFTNIRYRYSNAYRPFSLSPQLSAILFPVNNSSMSAYHDLSVFAGFKVQSFKFFVSAANLGSFWMKADQLWYDRTPIPAFQLQLGINWEFWN